MHALHHRRHLLFCSGIYSVISSSYLSYFTKRDATLSAISADFYQFDTGGVCYHQL